MGVFYVPNGWVDADNDRALYVHAYEVTDYRCRSYQGAGGVVLVHRDTNTGRGPAAQMNHDYRPWKGPYDFSSVYEPVPDIQQLPWASENPAKKRKARTPRKRKKEQPRGAGAMPGHKDYPMGLSDSAARQAEKEWREQQWHPDKRYPEWWPATQTSRKYWEKNDPTIYKSGNWGVSPYGLRLGGGLPRKGDVVLVVEEHEDSRYYFPVLMLSNIEEDVEFWFRGELLGEGLTTPRVLMISGHQIVDVIEEGDPLLQLARAFD